jgi:hypothetical protein
MEKMQEQLYVLFSMVGFLIGMMVMHIILHAGRW